MIPLVTLKVSQSYSPDEKAFRFLNRTVNFPGKINWSYAEEGTLWTYNLNYFEWLYDDSLTQDARLDTIKEFLTQSSHRAGLDGYPSSLRIIAWSRFFLKAGLKERNAALFLYQDVDWLTRFPEYAIDGNHLWENAMAILYGGIYFGNDRFFRKGAHLLRDCLKEQLFKDGGHMEGSPMYHSLLLWRLMQCYEVLISVRPQEDKLGNFIKCNAQKMLSWLMAMTAKDGSWPMVNDSAAGVAPSTKELIRYAEAIGLCGIKSARLDDSGYRLNRTGNFELFIDAAVIKPPYQPGHAHADIGTFCIWNDYQPLIVDTGISTYSKGARRDTERGTYAHNIICIDRKNSSDVWSVFRVGKRVKLLNIHETDGNFTLLYKDAYGNVIKRSFCYRNGCLTIANELQKKKTRYSELLLHFHPDITLTKESEYRFRAGNVTITSEAGCNLELGKYEFCNGFNCLTNAPLLRIASICDKVTVKFSLLP